MSFKSCRDPKIDLRIARSSLLNPSEVEDLVNKFIEVIQRTAWMTSIVSEKN